MNKFKLSLKWKITLLTIIMAITSASIVVTINFDISKTMPMAKNVIISSGGTYLLESEGEINNSEGNADLISAEDNEVMILEQRSVVENAINDAVSNIYKTSLMAFIIMVILGGICTYFLVTRSLKTIEQLNEMVSIDNLIQDVVDDLSVIATKNNVSIDFVVTGIEGKVLGNEILLYTAFYNVIENGIKYNEVNGTVRVECIQEDGIIKVIVSDTGKGIEEKDIENIFKEFYRCEGINLSSNNGVGLGLSIFKSVIILHGGTIKVNSEINKGTKFRISLPII